MSRSGYDDDCSGWTLICWRGAVNSALKGKRGQAALREIREALDAMPVKELAADILVSADGQFCTLGALGALGAARGMPLSDLVPDDPEGVAEKFGIATAMVREIVFENDEYPGMYGPDGKWGPETPEHRWQRMRKWFDVHILPVSP